MSDLKVLNLILLGTGQHRYASNAYQNVLNMLPDAIATNPDQTVHLIDGIGGEVVKGNASPLNPLLSYELQQIIEKEKWEAFLDEWYECKLPEFETVKNMAMFCRTAMKHLSEVLKSLQRDEKYAAIFENIERKIAKYVKTVMEWDFDVTKKDFLLGELSRVQEVLLQAKNALEKKINEKPLFNESSHPRIATYVFEKNGEDKNGQTIWKKTPKSDFKTTPSVLKSQLLGAGYKEVEEEGIMVIQDQLEKARAQKKLPLIVNMYGYSRGADTAIRLCNLLSDRLGARSKEVHINLFALDPVPGALRNQAKKAQILPALIKKAHFTFSENESSSLFSPTDFLKLKPQNSDQRTISYSFIPGGHFSSTVLGGNVEKGLPNVAEIEKATEDATLILHDALARFAQSNHTQFKTSPPYYGCIPYLRCAVKKGSALLTVSRAALLSDAQRLQCYSRMKLANNKTFFGKLYRTTVKPTRELVARKADIFLVGANYFQDEAHRQLFKKAYPAFFDYFFQHNVERAKFGKVLVEFNRMQEKDTDAVISLQEAGFPMGSLKNVVNQIALKEQLEKEAVFVNKKMIELIKKVDRFSKKTLSQDSLAEMASVMMSLVADLDEISKAINTTFQLNNPSCHFSKTDNAIDLFNGILIAVKQIFAQAKLALKGDIPQNAVMQALSEFNKTISGKGLEDIVASITQQMSGLIKANIPAPEGIPVSITIEGEEGAIKLREIVNRIMGAINMAIDNKIEVTKMNALREEIVAMRGSDAMDADKIAIIREKMMSLADSFFSATYKSSRKKLLVCQLYGAIGAEPTGISYADMVMERLVKFSKKEKNKELKHVIELAMNAFEAIKKKGYGNNKLAIDLIVEHCLHAVRVIHDQHAKITQELPLTKLFRTMQIETSCFLKEETEEAEKELYQVLANIIQFEDVHALTESRASMFSHAEKVKTVPAELNPSVKLVGHRSHH